jgi:hypothetical protein
MASMQELLPLVTDPREDLATEYKGWLDLGTNEHKATLAKAAIALVNHGGGFIVIGFQEASGIWSSTPCPVAVPAFTQDDVNGAIGRYAAPEFHCEMHRIVHPTTSVSHPVIVVPGTQKEPVMSKRECGTVLGLHRCYIRKPGPKSEEPKTGDEWRALLARCVRATREDMLDSIRTIMAGHIRVDPPEATQKDRLREFCKAANARWAELTAKLPEDSGARVPRGYFEMGLALVGATPARNAADLQDRLGRARQIKLTGWTPFLELRPLQWAPYVFDAFVEAWVGRPHDGAFSDAAHSDFWRVSLDGMLYSIRGYQEDGLEGKPSGTLFDITLPVWRIGEGILFAHRLAAAFEGVEAMAIRCRYTGLEGRKLICVTGRREVWDDQVSRSNEIVLETQATMHQVQDNLVEVLHQLLAPLYERFSFMRLPASLVDQEFRSMAKGRF